MNPTLIIVSVIAAFVTIVCFYIYLKSTSLLSGSGGETVIQYATIDATRSFTSDSTIMKSNNQEQGLTFSYAGWVMINDFNYSSGIIFNKNLCPLLSIDLNTNAFIIKMDTFGMVESIPINNIPAKKWIHFAIIVNQHVVDIYIDGVLHTHHVLAQLPRQNNSNVIVGGFNGQLSRLSYYPYVLTNVSSLASKIPAALPPPDAPPAIIYPAPPYFADSWWSSKKKI
jgi:hypothetical protein